MTKILELQLQHHPSNEDSELISLKIDWFVLLAVHGILQARTLEWVAISSSNA